MTEMVFRILLTLKDEVRDAESILKRIEELDDGGKPPPIASFYRGLKRALENGYLEILEVSKVGSPGRPPQRYRITRLGRSALEGEAHRLGRLARLALTSAGDSESRS